MNLNTYKEINREITLKNQELKSHLTDKINIIHVQNMELTRTKEENRRLQQIITNMEQNESENEKFRRMVLEMIHKTSAEFNAIVMAMTTGKYQTNNSAIFTPLTNITNQMQTKTNIKRQSNNTKKSIESKVANFTMPVNRMPNIECNLSLRSKTINAYENSNSPRNKSNPVPILGRRSNKAVLDESSKLNEENTLKALPHNDKEYCIFEKSAIINEEQLSAINESDEYKEINSSYKDNQSIDKILTEKYLTRSKNGQLETNFITVGRGGYGDRRKREPISLLVHSFIDSEQNSSLSDHDSFISSTSPNQNKSSSLYRKQSKLPIVKTSSKSSPTVDNSKIQNNGTISDESIIDFSVKPIVPSSTPFTVKKEQYISSNAVNDDDSDYNPSSEDSHSDVKRTRKKSTTKTSRKTTTKSKKRVTPKPIILDVNDVIVKNERPKRKAAPTKFIQPSLGKKLRRP